MSQPIRELPLPDGGKIAYRQRRGKSSESRGGTSPGVLFCGGFHSTMEGTKATCLDGWAARTGRDYVRFDYRGHGASSERFEDGTIGDWFSDARAVLDRVCGAPQIIVGSSMGAWMALLLARERPELVTGLVLLAPAPDFPRKLLWAGLADAAKAVLERDGLWHRPSEFGEDPYPITMRLIEESAAHEILDGPPIAFGGPVRILHGLKDVVVPLAHAARCLAAVMSEDVLLTVSKSGDHRLSTEADLKRMIAAVEGM